LALTDCSDPAAALATIRRERNQLAPDASRLTPGICSGHFKVGRE